MSLINFMQTMGSSNIPLIAAFFIGLMTAFSPCPLATNITAIAYVSKRIDHSKHTLLVGLLYTLGRMFTYIVLAALIVLVGINTPAISFGLQKYGERLLGPLLIIIGIVMLDVVKMTLPSKLDFTGIEKKLAKKRYFGSFLLGVIFALAFCPFSGVLYFGMLIPLAMKTGDPVFVPASFALATGLPVIVFSFILVHSVSKLGKIMNKVQLFEKWMRRVVAVVFLLVGFYYLVNTLF